MHNCRYALSFTFGSKGKATGNYWKKTVSEGMSLAYRSFKSVTSVSTLCRYVLLHISH